MFDGIFTILQFLQTYVVPIAFALGVIVFLYGFILYSVIGRPSGDTDVAERGRKHILNSCVIFVIALLIYGAVQGLIWVAENASIPSLFGGSDDAGGYGADVERDRDWLETPNAPRREE